MGFRSYARHHALALGLTGRVANDLDGTVVARVAGPPPALEIWFERLRQGPPAARVVGVEVNWLDEPPAYEGFRVAGEA